MSIGLQSGSPVSVDASVNKGRSSGEGTVVTHTGTTVTGESGVRVEAGRNMAVEGSRIAGNRVLVEVGRDLTMTSLQDTNIYTHREKNSGLQVSYNFNKITGSPLSSRTNMDSSYRSVTEQAGIYAGQGGYDVSVGKATRLKGAVIASEGPANQNKVTTKGLYVSNIENTANYTATGSGGSGLAGVASQSLGGLSTKGQASSTTRSAIAEGLIKAAEGDSVDTVNRNTENALQALKPIFDKKSVEEKLALSTLLSEEGFKLVGDIATKQ